MTLLFTCGEYEFSINFGGSFVMVKLANVVANVVSDGLIRRYLFFGEGFSNKIEILEFWQIVEKICSSVECF